RVAAVPPAPMVMSEGAGGGPGAPVTVRSWGAAAPASATGWAPHTGQVTRAVATVDSAPLGTTSHWCPCGQVTRVDMGHSFPVEFGRARPRPSRARRRLGRGLALPNWGAPTGAVRRAQRAGRVEVEADELGERAEPLFLPGALDGLLELAVGLLQGRPGRLGR